jgi:hypothetical protein
MLNWVRKEWLFVAALIAASGFWILALTGNFSLLMPPPEIRAISERAEKPNKEIAKVGPDERIADYTLGLEIFTGVLAASALINIGVLYRTDRTARFGTKLLARQTRIAQRQLAIQGAQTDIALAQKEISRLQFFAEYRPKLRMRLLKVDDLSRDKAIAVRYEITNVGGGDAFHIDAEITLSAVIDCGHGKKHCDWTNNFRLAESLVNGATIVVSNRFQSRPQFRVQ